MFTSSWFTSLCNRNKHNNVKQLCSYCCSVAQLCRTLCSPMDWSMPGLPVLHHFPKFAEVHVHCMGDAIQSSYPLILLLLPSIFPSIRDFSMSWQFASKDQNTGASASASILPTNIQGWFPLRLTGLISLLFGGLSGVFSSTTVLRHQFSGTLPPLRSSSHHVTNGKTTALTIQTFGSTVMSVSTHCLALSQLSCQGASFV